MKFFLIIFSILLAFASQASAYGPIAGFVDRVEGNQIFGWACQKGVAFSIDVHLYVRNSAGRPGAIIVKSVKANKPAEPAVGRACGTFGINHRYVITLTNHQMHIYKHSKIYVHGIKVVGNVPNSLLTRSGLEYVGGPPPYVGPIAGFVDRVEGNKIFGWACQKGVPRSIVVHLYVGNSAGRPGAIIVKGVKANQRSEAAVGRVCGTHGINHRYIITLTTHQMQLYKHKKVYVHGIKILGNVPNSLLTRSGLLRL